MVSKALITEQDGTPKQIVFANHAGDFSPTAANDLRITTDGSKETDSELVLLDLLNGAAAQSTKVDLGANRADSYAVRACIEMQVAVADAGSAIEFYWSSSQSATAGTGNEGACTGTAGAYSGYSSDLADSVKQLAFLGSMAMTDDAVDSIQVALVGQLNAVNRYGCLVVKNETGETICDTDDIEVHIVFDPIVMEAQ
jgi:hypothetical protein